MSGKKNDQEKVPLDLIPSDALFEIGKVLAAGAKKYERANWANGIEISRLISAAMRHLLEFNNGEDIDEECNTLHLANSAVNLIFAIWMYKNRPDMDDRWIKRFKKSTIYSKSIEPRPTSEYYESITQLYNTSNADINHETEDNSSYAKVARGMVKFNKEKT